MRRLAIALCALLLIACSRSSNKPSSPPPEERVVVIAQQYSEILWALGAEENIVGVDLSSTFPPALEKVQKVGYHRALSAEGILSLRPTLVIHDNNVGPEQVLKQLASLEIPIKTFNEKSSTVDATKALIREIGAYAKKEPRAEELCKKLDQELETARAEAQTHTDRPTVVIIHFGRATNVYLTVTSGSSAGQLVAWAGGRMAIEGPGAMRQLTSPELIAQANPDVVLVTDYGYDRLGTTEKIKELPGLAGTNAAKSDRIYRVAEHELMYFGPRTGENLAKLVKLLHRAK